MIHEAVNKETAALREALKQASEKMTGTAFNWDSALHDAYEIMQDALKRTA